MTRTSSMYTMSMPAQLCSACLGALQSGLEDVLEKTMYADCTHHATFAAFQEAVAHNCFICVKLWASIRRGVLASWKTDTTNWLPLKCSLQRRPWAAEWYDPIYWHIIYLGFDLQQLDMSDLNYRGNVFCLFKNADGKKRQVEEAHESSTASIVVHEQAHTWYEVCRDSHKTCKRLGPGGKYTPTRLVDVGSAGDETWKLCLQSEDIEEFPAYLTLSYRWAKDPDVLLLSSTIDNFREGALISDLPKTFKDAIDIARNFSIKYIWIDSLCIIQDSPEDWARESILMHDVYANSACNIAASASENPQGGLFRSRTANEVCLGYITVDIPNLGTKNFNIWDQFYMDRITHGPLTDRGWVFQERVLSPRVIHFSQYQIAWECFEMSKCETFPNWSPYPTEVDYSRGLKTLHALSDCASRIGTFPSKRGDETMATSGGVYEEWKHLVKTYSRCAFTCPEDRLIAMEGIAKLFERRTGDKYLAGLWRSKLVEGLNWVVVNPLARPQTHDRVPSWSWAAVDSAILPQAVNLPRDDDLVEIISAEVDDPITPAGWRKVHGRIKLRGCLTEATILEGCTQIGVTRDASATPIKLMGFPSRLFVLPDTTDVFFTAGGPLHLLPLRSTLRRITGGGDTEIDEILGTPVVILEGMILEHVAEEDVYRRVGRFVVDDLDHVDFLGLRAFPPWPGATAFKVVINETRTSVFTLV